MAHPSHKTRISDGSLYDEKCVLCGATDGPGDNRLDKVCPCAKKAKDESIHDEDFLDHETAHSEASEDLMCGVEPKPKFTPTKYDASAILLMAADHLQDRATKYDQPQGERSMPAAVAAFNAITGHSLTEEQGWLFMEVLKCVRAEANAYHPDNYEDGVAYAALKGEAAARNRKKDA